MKYRYTDKYSNNYEDYIYTDNESYNRKKKKYTENYRELDDISTDNDYSYEDEEYERS